MIDLARERFIRCRKCGVEIGEYKLDRIDKRLKEFGIDGGRVYKPYYFDNADTDTLQLCKECKTAAG